MPEEILAFFIKYLWASNCSSQKVRLTDIFSGFAVSQKAWKIPQRRRE